MTPKLSIVVHAEEEFDWNGGFYRSNNQVSHGKELIEFVDEIIQVGGKVTLAMDYAFVDSEDGKQVITHFKPLEGESIEFASHLHPWVNPPFKSDSDQVSNFESFPGNLSRSLEFEKLKVLTEKIEQVTGTRPITYLAGRYGTGPNTASILKELGYKVDLSISAYSNFSHIDGPDFTCYSNRSYIDGLLTLIPHTCSIISPIKMVENYLNTHPSQIHLIQKNIFFCILSKILRVKKYRLSTEGFTYDNIKKIVESQTRIGQDEFLFSFHSPSTKVGVTPYVKTDKELMSLKEDTLNFITWFLLSANGRSYIFKNRTS